MNKWDVTNNAVLRTALFFEITQLKLDNLENVIFQNTYLFNDKNKIFQSCYDYVCSLIDEFFTPFIIKEINIQRNTLIGNTSQERYASFFLTSDIKWKKEALSIETKYNIQINKIVRLIQSEIKSLVCFIERLINDLQEISSEFNITSKIIENIEITNSDRHNFLGPVIFVVFKNNFKIVYKSKNMDTDICLKKIIKILHCENILYCPRYIDKKKYSWSEFIVHELYNKKNYQCFIKIWDCN